MPRADEGSSLTQQLRHGEALEAAGALDAALDCYEACVRDHPASLDAHLALANALAQAWRVEDSIRAFHAALSAAPDNTEVFSGLLLYSHYAAAPDASALYALHRRYGHLVSEKTARQRPPVHPDPMDTERMLRIGYVSRNLSAHSVGYFIEPVVAAHDRSRHRVYCYYGHPASDDTTARIARAADVWVPVHGMADDALAARVREDRIDILVDLEGHTKLNRLPVFARRAAPVQITWLGYPDTTGLDAIDYRITDATADPPPHAEARHSERLLRLDAPFLCYRPPADSPPVRPRGPGSAVVFGSCNVLLKVNPPLLALWARILEGVPDSRLLIKSSLLDNAEVAGRLLAQFRAAGIAPGRLDLRGWAADRVGHLGTYDGIDIALDTFPYHGTTTTCEALWMGVPVVTQAGTLHMSRVGASLLRAAGLADLVADNADDYANIAIALARDPARRTALRGRMREQLAASPLLDHRAFVGKLEAAYRQAWRRCCDRA